MSTSEIKIYKSITVFCWW